MKTIKNLVTGNEFISIPELNTGTGSIKDITLLHYRSKGLLDLRGDDDGLFNISISVDDVLIDNQKIEWSLVNYWIPRGIYEDNIIKIELTILAPLGHKGFVYNVVQTNKSLKDVTIKVRFWGRLKGLYHCVNEEMFFDGKYEKLKSTWNDSFYYSISQGFPCLSFAPIVDSEFISSDSSVDGLSYSFECESILNKESCKSVNAYWGFGYEQVSAITAAREMERWGIVALNNETNKYLVDKKIVTMSSEFDELLNRNLFFNIFYSTGKTIDTEQRVMVTSRSPKYYVSASYWDRDGLLWAFPSIAKVDPELAKEMLMYVATVQAKNVGIHSRYIDGSVLEPGFELDELCAPILAIDNYLTLNNDVSLLKDHYIDKLIQKIIKTLELKRSDKLGLYETFLQPTDDMNVYPYLTYNNVLVWKVYKILESFNFNGTKGLWANKAENVKSAIYKNCIKTIDDRDLFIWSVDEDNHYDIYDEPPGSLILLSTLGFCDNEDEIYKNSVQTILSEDYKYSFSDKPFGAIGCEHAKHPWILSLANLFRVQKSEDTLQKLLKAQMDDGLACESIDEYSGVSTTGDAFATCAGYLSYSLMVGKNIF
ncbi:MAG: glycoside hydrolase family 125 protein [Sphaerochaeta sp.]